MKKGILTLSLLLVIGLLDAQNTDVVAYKKLLPSISKKGVVKTSSHTPFEHSEKQGVIQNSRIF